MTPILNWIKSHLLIVIMCAVAVIVLPAVIYASSAWNTSIAREITKRVGDQDQKISRVSSAQVVVKPLAPGSPSIEKSMTLNEGLIDEYRKVREAIKEDATALEQWVVEVNRSGKSELVPGLLPEPSRVQMNELPFRIHGAFIRAHEELLRRSGAGMPPAPDLMQEQLVEFERNYRRTQFNVGPEVALTEVERTKLAEAMTARRLAIYAQAAQEHSVFADINVFALQQWQDQKAPDKLRWWEWQHTYWVNADIMAAVQRANTIDGERATVIGEPASAIKRLVSVAPEAIFPPNLTEESLRPKPEEPTESPMGGGMEGMAMGGMEGMPMGGMEGRSTSKMGTFEVPVGERGGAAGGAAPAPEATAFADPTQPFPPDYTRSISGRASKTGLYDMRRVKLLLIVDSRRLKQVLDAFHTTNFMSVVGFRTVPLELSSELAQGFYYGADPVIQVELEVETLWLRDWTVKLMPPPVKTFFGVVEPPKAEG